jgi:hypothetical protein
MITDQVRGYFGFERLPFDRSLPVSQMFASASHHEAVARIGYAIATRGLAVLTGEVGAGKTAAVRAATAGLDASRHHLVYLPNPQVGARGIHHAIVSALGGVPRFHHAMLIPQAAEALASELAERGRITVIVVDEAHLLAHDQLEAIRMLTLCRDSDYAGRSPGVPWRPRSRKSGGRDNHRPSRNARSLSGARYLPVFVVCDGVRARAFSLSLRSAWMYGCVDRGLSCPIQSAMVTGSTPACNSAIAAECRRVCGVTCLSRMDGQLAAAVAMCRSTRS